DTTPAPRPAPELWLAVHLPQLPLDIATRGHAERKAMAMSLVDRALRADEFSEPLTSPAQQQEFALAHSDNVEASGFVQHLKLPHYVTFESELQMLRAIRADRATPPETQP
ncbi:MAG: carbon-phosphorus lyase complex subunit PhnI, partial [Inhella sp.]